MPRGPALGYVGLTKQASQGTPLAPTKFFRWQTAMFSPKQTVKAYHDGTNRDLGAATKVAVWDEGKFRTMLYPDTGTLLLLLALAGTDVPAGGTDPYTHTFSNTQAALPWVTFEYSMGQGIEIERITDCLINDLTIEGKAGESVFVDVDYKGRVIAAQGSASTVTFEADRPMTFMDGTLTYTGLTVTSSDVVNLKMQIKNNVGQEYGYGSPTPVWIFGQAREIDLEFDVFVPDNVLWRQIWFGSAGATAPISAPTFLTTLVVLFDAQVTPARKVQITLNNIVIESADPTFDNTGKAFVVKCKGKCILPSSGSMVTVVGTNGIATGY